MKRITYIIGLAALALLSACEKNALDVQDFGRVIVDSISPASGPAGSYLVVHGRNFAYQAAEAKVFINNVSATVVEARPDSLIVLIPATATTGRLSFSFNRTDVGHGHFNYGGQVDSMAEGPVFTVNPALVPMPIMKSVTPRNGKAGDVITLKGYNFSAATEVCKIFFGNVQAEVISVTATEVQVKVPVATPGKALLTVQQGQYAIAADSFLVDETPKGVREIYWGQAEGSNNGICKATFDAQGNPVIEVLYDMADGVSYPDRGVKADAANGLLYWADGDKIYKGSTDGAMPMTAIYTDPAAVYDLDLDAAGNLYFASLGGSSGSTNAIKKIGADGTATVLYEFSADAMPIGIKVDAANGKIYWAEIGSVSVFEGSINGSATQPAKLLYNAADGIGAPANIAIDPVNQKIYIIDLNMGRFFSGALNGEGSLSELPITGTDFLAPIDVEIDVANQFLYWMNIDFQAGNMMRAKVDGTGIQRVITPVKYGQFIDLVL